MPIGSRQVILEMAVQRLECKECGAVQQERIHFAHGKERYTFRMRDYVLDLCRLGTIVAVARQVHMSWDTVKDILKSDLSRTYSRPDLKGLRYIGIDEFAVAKGHVYMTIVVDLETGRIVYVGEGKGADALDGLWPKLRQGQWWLLLAGGDSLSPKAEERLHKALDINRPLATAYYHKESLCRVWWQDNKQDAALVLDDWIEQARQSDLRPIESIADTLSRHRDGILAWYDCRISNGKLEGINNKIKTMKRQAYVYRDMPFFKLKLLSLHDPFYLTLW